MSVTINQDNLRLILPGKISGLARQLMQSRNWEPLKALMNVYHSRLYAKLEQEDTKLWHYSPEQLFILGNFDRVVITQVHHGKGHSHLLQWQKQIMSAWKKRQSARKIADWLQTQGIVTSPQNVWKFIQCHSKHS